MRLINQTKNTVLAENVFICTTLLQRAKGLLGKKSLLPGQAILLSPCNSVHTFFMRFDIDVLFVDKDYRVIKTVSTLKPGRITPAYWRACKVIELPAAKINLSNTQANDQLQLLD
jgi:uncharacterized protein